MSERSIIVQDRPWENPEKRYKAIYVHNAFETSLLLDHWNTHERVNRLVRGPMLSELGSSFATCRALTNAKTWRYRPTERLAELARMQDDAYFIFLHRPKGWVWYRNPAFVRRYLWADKKDITTEELEQMFGAPEELPVAGYITSEEGKPFEAYDSPERHRSVLIIDLHGAFAQLPPEENRFWKRARKAGGRMAENLYMLASFDHDTMERLNSIVETTGAAVGVVGGAHEAHDCAELSALMRRVGARFDVVVRFGSLEDVDLYRKLFISGPRGANDRVVVVSGRMNELIPDAVEPHPTAGIDIRVADRIVKQFVL